MVVFGPSVHLHAASYLLESQRAFDSWLGMNRDPTVRGPPNGRLNRSQGLQSRSMKIDIACENSTRPNVTHPTLSNTLDHRSDFQLVAGLAATDRLPAPKHSLSITQHIRHNRKRRPLASLAQQQDPNPRSPNYYWPRRIIAHLGWQTRLRELGIERSGGGSALWWVIYIKRGFDGLTR